MRSLALLLCAVLSATAAHGQSLTLLGVGRGAGYLGPGDIVAHTAWYGLRCYNAAKKSATQAINIRRTSDSTTTDIGLTATCDLDAATASTFCSATTCFVTKVYDQTGGGRDVSEAVTADQPQLIFSCTPTGRPCTQSSSSSIIMSSAANFTPATGLVSFESVSDRVSGTGATVVIGENGANNKITYPATANKLSLTGGSSGAIQPTANDNAWHAAAGLINGASSVFNVDNNAETTGTVTGNTTAVPIRFIIGTASTTVNQVEAGFIDNTSYTAAQRSTLVANARNYWGF